MAKKKWTEEQWTAAWEKATGRTYKEKNKLIKRARDKWVKEQKEKYGNYIPSKKLTKIVETAETGSPAALKKFSSVTELEQYLTGRIPASEQSSTKLLTNSIRGIEGVPYQFMGSVDRRMQNIGRKYGERVMARMPLLFLTPCEPIFMDDFNNQDSGLLAGALSGNIQISDALALLGTKRTQAKYYSVDFNYKDYYDILDAMLLCLSTYLGIQDRYITMTPYKKNGKRGKRKYTKIKNCSWRGELNKDFKTFFNCAENLVFYLDGLDTVSESFSNDTTESQLKSAMDTVADSVHEVMFLFGNNSNTVSALRQGTANVTNVLGNVASPLADKLAGGIIASISENAESFLDGGKIVFPKIWSDSSFDRSYQLDFKFRSPDHDSLSIFLNVLKPYCKLLALTLPRALPNNDPNLYRSPFLVKAACKGLFSIDMGIISSMSVTKGAQCCWNDDGLPTQIDVSISIDDLYSSMHLNGYAGWQPWKNFVDGAILGIVNNTAYQDYLAN